MGFFLGGTELDVAAVVIAAVRAKAATMRREFRAALDYGLRPFMSTPLTARERAIVDAAVQRAHEIAKERDDDLRGGRCYQVARAVVEADVTGEIHYTEGFYIYPKDPSEPIHHGWVTINNKVVDLFGQHAAVYGTVPAGAGYAGRVFSHAEVAEIEGTEGALYLNKAKGRFEWRSVFKLVAERKIPRPLPT